VALVKRREEMWIGPAIRWTLVSFVLLGTGIVLGGFWAYKVLGWGGYWGWDPVENASLIPWIIITALVHGLIVQKATGALPRTNLVLALAAYATVFYATFLTRSGVLADFSVHSFPAGSIYKILLGIQFLIVGVSLVLFFRRWSIKSREIPTQLAWPLALTVAVVMFVLSAGMVFIGTSWPIITTWLGKPAAFGPSWYNTVSLPIYVVLLALLGVAPFLAWVKRPISVVSRRLVLSSAAALLATGGAVAFGSRGVGALLLFFVAAAALSANMIRLVEIGRGRMLNSGPALAHIGFALMLLGIIGSSFWGSAGELRLPQGQPVEQLGRTFTYIGHVDGSEPEDRWRVRIEKPGSAPVQADVAMYRTGSGQESQVMHEPAILRRWAGDLYLAPAGVESLVEHQDLELIRGQPSQVGPASLTFVQFEMHEMGQSGMTVVAQVRIEQDGQSEVLRLPYTMARGQAETPPVAPTIDTEFESLQLTRMAVEQQRILVHLDRPTGDATPILSLNVSTKPIIGLLWAGTLLLGVGCTVAWARRLVDERAIERATAAAQPTPMPTKGQRKKRRALRAPKPAHAG
jgi:cytochrome c-type biogenesis protein CcmF